MFHRTRFPSTLAFLLACTSALAAPIRDVPFQQDEAVRLHHDKALEGAQFRRLEVDREGTVFVLSDRGLARLFGDTLAPDQSFRALSALKPLDISCRQGRLYHLYDDRFLCNDFAGEPLGHLPKGQFSRLAVSSDGVVLLADSEGLAEWREGRIRPIAGWTGGKSIRVQADETGFLVLAGTELWRIRDGRASALCRADGLTCFAPRGPEMILGTRQGFVVVDAVSGAVVGTLQTRLPSTNITCITVATNGVWFGTPRGAFFRADDGHTDYYASKRWLRDDAVIDIRLGADHDVFLLTATGLNRITFRDMTLAQKAEHYQTKIRRRHLRFGLISELRLTRAGDPSSAEMIDTDNDGSWSSYYMASQALRFAVTGEPEAHRCAWETFAALERLQTINGLDGFPSRTFERHGFKFSDPDRWHETKDGDWDWKAHTSSDEIIDHTFGYAVLYECAARTAAEKARIASVFTRILEHIIRNNWYLVDVDGKPTLWGRWNPEYVNWYPPTIVDRRLNSAEIIAMLQLGWRMTGKEEYRQKATELFDRHGYLTNILSSMKLVSPTKGFIHFGDDMGNEWNHSDDQLGFDCYFVLHRHAFTETLKRQYAGAIRDHWELERRERNPLWNFFLAATGDPDFDAEGAAWTLRQFPLELVTWRVENSHRADITRKPENFRHEQLEELLPADERQITRWNTQPFVLDGGDGGQIEFAGDEFLLPYWLGRYLKVIE